MTTQPNNFETLFGEWTELNRLLGALYTKWAIEVPNPRAPFYYKIAGIAAVAATFIIVSANISSLNAQGYGCPLVNKNTAPAKALDALLCSARDLLRDPETARFRRLHVTKFNYVDGRPPGWALCGEVNSRNALGGLTGWQGFSYTDAEHRLLQTMAMCIGNPVLAGSR